MKRLSSWLTVLLLGALPLTAAALDYGPNHTLLAVENSVPQMPDAQVRSAPPEDATPQVDTVDILPVASRATPGTSPAPPPVRPATAGTPQSTAAKTDPAPTPDPSSWQSLLPGSIQ